MQKSVKFLLRWIGNADAFKESRWFRAPACKVKCCRLRWLCCLSMLPTLWLAGGCLAQWPASSGWPRMFSAALLPSSIFVSLLWTGTMPRNQLILNQSQLMTTDCNILKDHKYRISPFFPLKISHFGRNYNQLQLRLLHEYEQNRIN